MYFNKINCSIPSNSPQKVSVVLMSANLVFGLHAYFLKINGYDQNEKERKLDNKNSHCDCTKQTLENVLSANSAQYNEIDEPKSTDSKKGSKPRSIVNKFHDFEDREYIIKQEKASKSTISIHTPSPEKVTNDRKRLFDIKNRYSKLDIETKIVGDELVFRGSSP
ncbi:hypothetical protein KUTeg_008447 [Tegillarca granosa]|uniref:Uncharacterized protein n=1 Tax=Tegillarca granosa TaxID=220873 RepID=A0ABQ9FCE3_TEGGR|nr:hypothetical protein KUTeg_008447 [Tegillarca granosa]